MSLISIYQVLPRLFGNTQENVVENGSRSENGTGKMNDFTLDVLSKIRQNGYTHIWYTGLIEHARCTADTEFGIAAGNPQIIKGKAGSPYAIVDYYDIDPDIAVSVPNRILEFQQLVERTHKAGLKIIIDFVPNHVARQYHSDVKPETDFGINDHTEWNFSPLNDFYYTNEPLHLPQNSGTKIDYGFNPYVEEPAKVTGNDQFSAYPSINDWYETVKLNYGVDYCNNGNRCFEPQPVVWQKMLDILCYWAEMGVDAFRCDMAEMVPVEFWNFAIARVKEKFPHIQFIAEVYNPMMYNEYIFHGGFDYLYDKVGLYDTLRNIICFGSPAYTITHAWQKLCGIDAKMLRFLENHDEQRIASPFFAGSATKAIPAMVVTATLNKGAVMVYFGQEFGENAAGVAGFSGNDGRTTIFDYYKVPTIQRWFNKGKLNTDRLSADEVMLSNFYKTLLSLVTTNKCFTDGDFYDLMWVNGGNADVSKIYAFLRHIDGKAMLVVVNFDNYNTHNFNLIIPEHAWQTMNIPYDSDVELKPVFGVTESIKATAYATMHRGIGLSVGAMCGVIYSLSTED